MEQRISFLLQQRLEQKLTTAEAEELLTVLQNPEYDTIVTDILQQLAVSQQQGPAFDPVVLQQWVQGIVAIDKHLGGVVGNEAGARPVHRVNFLRTAWFRYAAILLLLIGAGTLFYTRRIHKEAITRQELSKVPDVAPGGNKAVLTLSDGSLIVLDSAGNGTLTQQGSTRVIKSGAGQLAYEAGAGDKPTASGKIEYNTVSTPRGGQYQVELPDGSKVWLNASSSLHFPTAFPGRSREVEITGEAYFEVAKDVNKPFYVKVNGQSVEVLGTQFNINAYTDEPLIRTTLLEGSVRITNGKSVAKLAPGQQAKVPNPLSGTEGIKVVNDADLEEAMAWKNGLFHLTSADIGTIMRQLVRWYDVEVDFEGGIPSGHITGEVPRSTSLAKVLKVFETSGVHFRIEGRKIIVTP
jgi:transmembrane sensor